MTAGSRGTLSALSDSWRRKRAPTRAPWPSCGRAPSKATGCGTSFRSCGLGPQPAGADFGIASADEARAYLAHPILGPRLIECTQLALDANKASAAAIFPYPDDLKFRSCMTLFAQVAPEPNVFTAALAKYCGGEPDPETLRLLKR